ncbi:MAG: hypothetical protein IJ636_03670 [Bacteroidales bacterium]|nr:hypothetical protein [Bacteroidales bacterium]
MTNFFLTAICAALLSAGTPAAPADTLNRYVIDKQVVENFDGSQLAGTKVLAYEITTANEDGQVVRIHEIRTNRGVEPLVIINGNVISFKKMHSIDPASIESIQVLKDKSAQAYEKYGETANGVIVITIKEPGTYEPSRGKFSSIQIRVGDKNKNNNKKQ